MYVDGNLFSLSSILEMLGISECVFLNTISPKSTRTSFLSFIGPINDGEPVITFIDPFSSKLNIAE